MNKSTKAWLLLGVVASALSASVNAKTFSTSAVGASDLLSVEASLVQNKESKYNTMGAVNASSLLGNDLVVHSKVPEPETYALIGVGLLGLMLAHRRKYI